MAAVIRVVRSSETAGSPLITRDTVLMLTPAKAATSRMVGRDLVMAPLSVRVNVISRVCTLSQKPAWPGTHLPSGESAVITDNVDISQHVPCVCGEGWRGRDR